MTPSARLQAAIELVEAIAIAAREGGAAADTLIRDYFKQRRYAGSGDRRAVRDLVYRAIRRSGERPASGRAALLGLAGQDQDLLALFDGSPHGPRAIDAGEIGAGAAVVPAWLLPRLDPLVSAEEVPSLLDRAPLDLRVNRLKGDREAALALLPEASLTPLSPLGLRLPEGSQVENGEAWGSGLVEVQDEGSQLVALACAVAPGQDVIDLCAGAGGKTLALAAEMDHRGRIIASDTDRGRLSRLAPRLARAGVTTVEQRLLDPRAELDALADWRGMADAVLVDAPCSGSGTWRRNPETRWRLDPQRLSRLVELQAYLLDVAAELVRPGGTVTYAVCSLLAEEGREQALGFHARRSSFVSEAPAIPGGRSCGPGRLLTPGHDGTDGFFVARWQAPC
jgi:16S rRNA (cytosine967-C5)-methyltransferase